MAEGFEFSPWNLIELSMERIQIHDEVPRKKFIFSKESKINFLMLLYFR
jgi:hypothetical protein